MNKKKAYEQSDRKSFIDALKGICIIFVVITHYSWSGEERLKYLFPYWIDMAVPIFMIISGYVYYFSYKKDGINEIWDAYKPAFFMRKLIRYTIPFATVYIIEQAIRIFLGEITISFKDFFDGCILFLQGGIGPGSFYYPIMIQLIFVFPLIFFVIEKFGDKGLAICGLSNMIYELMQRAYGMSEDYYRLSVFRYVLVIAIGCYIARGEIIHNRFFMITAFLVGFTFITAVCYWGYSPKVIRYWARTSFLACLYIIPIAFIFFARMRTWSFKPIEMIGKASYNVFLFQMAWYGFKERIIGFDMNSKAAEVVIDILACIVGGLVFYYVETPLTQKINNRVKNKLCENGEDKK